MQCTQRFLERFPSIVINVKVLIPLNIQPQKFLASHHYRAPQKNTKLVCYTVYFITQEM